MRNKNHHLFFTFFLGNSMTMKNWKVCKFYCQQFCCHMGGSHILGLKLGSSQTWLSQTCPNWGTDAGLGRESSGSVATILVTSASLFDSETGRIRFRGVRFQTPSSVSFLAFTEFRGASSVSSSRPVICVPKRTHRVFRRTQRVCRKTQ